MKNMMIFVFGALMMFQAPVFAKSKRHQIQEKLEVPIERTISLTDLTPGESKQILMGISPNIAVECKEGTQLPIKYLLKGSFFSMHYAPDLSFKIEKNFFLRVILNKVFVSSDLTKWEKPKMGLLETYLEISPDKSYLLIEAREEPSNQISQL